MFGNVPRDICSQHSYGKLSITNGRLFRNGEDDEGEWVQSNVLSSRVSHYQNGGSFKIELETVHAGHGWLRSIHIPPR